MDNIHKIKQDRIRSRRAVAPIIATLLMIAIAVVGGVMIYVFTQGFFGNSAISTSPSVDTITMTGYDMRGILASATDGIDSHEGVKQVTFGGIINVAGLQTGEEGAIYIKNVGSKQYSIAKLEVNGAPVVFASSTPGSPTDGEYVIVTPPSANVGTGGTTHQLAATVLPGQEATLIVSFSDGLAGGAISPIDNQSQDGRTIPVKITSASGSVYNFNVVVGSKA